MAETKLYALFQLLFYIDFSLLILIITTAVLYFAVCLLRRFGNSGIYSEFDIIIRIRDKIIKLDGLADTGNSLVDFFTGKAVIICPEAISEDLPEAMKTRIIPVSTVSGDDLMKIFKPDEVIIISRNNGERKAVEVMIGLGKAEKMAIFNPKIIL